MSNDRSFTVVHAVAGLEPGAQVDEAQLEGCNVDALLEGGFLEESGGISPTSQQPTPQGPPDSSEPPPAA